MNGGTPNDELRERLAEDVKRLVGGHMGIPAMTVSEHHRIQEDLGADAFDQVELVMTANERFKVRIPLDAAASISTIADLVDAVRERSRRSDGELL